MLIRRWKIRKLERERDAKLGRLREWVQGMVKGHRFLASDDYYRAVERVWDEHGARIMKEYEERIAAI